MAQYEERYKIIFELDANGGAGPNINITTTGSVASGGGTTAAGVGGLAGIAGSILDNAFGSIGKLGITGFISPPKASLASRRAALSRYGRFGDPSSSLTGKGTTEVGLKPGQMSPYDLGRSKWNAFADKEEAYNKAEMDFEKAVRSKGWNKEKLVRDARERWAAQDAARKATTYNASEYIPGGTPAASFSVPPVSPIGAEGPGMTLVNQIQLIKKAENTRK